jgi:NADH:ubiquinone oxidoreductase subunit K
MKLSTRLTVAMVALVLFTAGATGILIYRNVLGVALPRSLERLGAHVQLLATELEAVVRGARADVLALAVDEMVHGSSGDIGDRSNVFAVAQRRLLASRFSAELTAKPWYDELRIIGIADSGREIVSVDRSGAGGAVPRCTRLGA